MTRLTEYHNGVAVIKDKRFKEAAEKLAMYEDWEEDGEYLMLKEQLEMAIALEGGGSDE